MVDIATNKEAGYYLIKVDGEVDASSSIHLDNAVNLAVEEDHKKIIVDLAGLEYISSAGLGVFMSYIEEFEQKNIAMALYGLQEKVVNVFQILGLDELLNIVDTKEEAIKTVDGA